MNDSLNRYYKAKLTGKCGRCQSPKLSRQPKDSKIFCDICYEKRKSQKLKLHTKLKINGLCQRCRINQRTTGVNCENCAKIIRERTYKAKRKLLDRLCCINCGKPKFDKYVHCSDCIIKNNKKRLKQKQIVFDAYGKICACCKESEPTFLSIDHMNNDCAKHRKTIGSGIYRWLIKNNFPSGFQILCMNCNFGKKFLGICPHKHHK